VGLGLAIVRAGIEAGGGRVRAETVRPHGLALIFRLRRENYDKSSNLSDGLPAAVDERR
jgi:K+-sensing histidine kinase KdpD